MKGTELLDSNVVIQYDRGQLPPAGKALVDRMVNDGALVSVVTKIEVLRFPGAPAEMARLRAFMNAATVYPLTDTIVDRTIALARGRRIKLGDAIIAATALEHGLVLVTHNVNDFKSVEGLNILNPWE